ncbi:MAG: 16S rRNA (guanine(966)-N(2))-methyltransferase RsmD [Thermodesulfovibrionales bacterium]|nr:16S rRNA (guanine(966)-N(2))-methyltransferase RsmD [Thermodesulfovibrionales bacterium]
MRIIGGEKKGRVIRCSKSLFNTDLRPTSQKVRKAFFDIIREKIIYAEFLDLFAGTGAIGFEALSRGAKKVVFVEYKKSLINNIKKFSQQTDFIKNIEIINDESIRFLKKTDYTFDIVFADPPYDYEHYKELFEILGERDIINEDGIFAIEHSSKKIVCENTIYYDFIKTYKYGDTSLSFFKRRVQN